MDERWPPWLRLGVAMGRLTSRQHGGATDKRAKRGRRAHRRKDLPNNRYGTMLHVCYPYASYRLHLVCCWGVATHCLRYGCGGVAGEDPECVRQTEM